MRSPTEPLAKEPFSLEPVIISLPVLLTTFLWLRSPIPILPLQGFCGFLLLAFPCWSFVKWRRAPRERLPLFAMISFMYWLYFAFPLFWGARTISTLWALEEIMPDEAITKSMVMAVLGDACLWLGMNSRIGRRLVLRAKPDIPADSSRWLYLRIMIVLGTLVCWNEASARVLGEGGRQIVLIFQSFIPMVAFAVLFRNYLFGYATRLDKVLIVTFLIARLIVGLSSGWLGEMAFVIVSCAAIYIGERKRVPRFAVALAIIYMLFFQVGKPAFREMYWDGEAQASRIERLAFWVKESKAEWGSALSGEAAGKTTEDLVHSSLSRISLLTETAHVINLTPAIVPYQHGRLYSYLAAMLIPRFLWPDKPTIVEANQFFQVAYGFTPEEQLGSVSLSIGISAEAYINWGWIGVVFIMIILGVLLDFFQSTFLSETSGLLFRALGVALLPGFLTIESQFALYLGGVIQKTFYALLMLLPIIHLDRRAQTKLIGSPMLQEG